MYSEALKILDKNTVEYMIDELKDQLAQYKDELARQKSESDAEIQQLRQRLEKYERNLK